MAEHKKNQDSLENLQLAQKLDAISKSQAIIEFNLDGTILTANENFLKTLGYQLEEIQGKHHRIFCDDTYTSTPEYKVFWEKLARGEFDSGEYKRKHKSYHIFNHMQYDTTPYATGYFAQAACHHTQYKYIQTYVPLAMCHTE